MLSWSNDKRICKLFHHPQQWHRNVRAICPCQVLPGYQVQRRELIELRRLQERVKLSVLPQRRFSQLKMPMPHGWVIQSPVHTDTVRPDPTFVRYHFVLTQPTINFRPKTEFVWWSQRFDARNKRRMHTAYNPELAARTTRQTKPAPGLHQSTLRRMCTSQNYIVNSS